MKNTICVLFLLLATTTAFTQGWELFWGTPEETDIAYSVIEAQDGDIVVAGIFGFDTAFVRKITFEGEEVWTQTYPKGDRQNVLNHPQGGYLLFGTKNGAGEKTMRRLDADGNQVWAKPELAYSDAWTALPDGFINVRVETPPIINLMKIDLDGEFLWAKEVNVPGLFNGEVAPTADGGFVVGGSMFNSPDAAIVKFDSAGEVEWSATGGTNLDDSGNITIVQTMDGGYVMTLDLTQNDFTSIIKFSSTGEVVWTDLFDAIPGSQTHLALGIDEDPEGNIIIAGALFSTYLLKYSPDGEMLFFKTFNGDEFRNVVALSNGFYCAVGSDEPFEPDNSEAYVLLTNSYGEIYPNIVQGQLGLDENNDCEIQSTEQPLEGWIVSAQSLTTSYVLTNADGQYRIDLDTGEYTLSIFPPNDLWSPCENPIELDVNFGDTLTADFPVQVAIECPAMQVDIGIPFLRRCFENTLTVQYCNLGTVAAEDASVEVTLDSLLEFVSSSLAPSGQTGNTFTFLLGDMDVMDCGSFQITVLVSCDAELGQALCMEAHVFPDSICGVPFNWSGASMVARAKCQGDTTVILELENIGTVPTSEPLDYIVIEDQIIFLEGNQVFDPAEVWTFTQPANGATWRVISEQEPNHPGFSFPTAFVEGCGTNSLGMFSTGFVN